MSNILPLKKTSSVETWLETYKDTLTAKLPFGQPAEPLRQVHLPQPEHPILKNEDLCSLYSLFPGYRIPQTSVMIGYTAEPVLLKTQAQPYVVELSAAIRAEPLISDKARKLAFGLRFIRAVAETMLLQAWRENVELLHGGWSLDAKREPVTGQQLLGQFADIVQNSPPISKPAELHRRKYGDEDGQAVIKEAAEAIAVYVTGIAFRSPKESPTLHPFANRAQQRVWCEDFLGLCLCTAHD